MMLTKSRVYKLFLVLLVLTLVISACSFFGGGADPPTNNNNAEVNEEPDKDDDDDVYTFLIATLTELTGSVQVTSQSTGSSALAFIGQQLVLGDEVMTGVDSRTRVDYANGTFFRVGPNTQAQIVSVDTDVDEGFLANLKLTAGEIWVVLTGGELIVDTPSGVASVIGSYMSVSYDPVTGELTVTCLEGVCHVSNAAGGVIMYAGQIAVITSINSSILRGVMQDSDVQWWLDNNPEASIILADVTATVEAYSGIDPIGVGTVTPTPSPTPTALGALPPACYVGTWNVPASTIQNYMVVALTNAGYGNITPSVTGSGTVTISANGAASVAGGYTVHLSSGMGSIATPFSLSGSGSATAFVTSANGRLNIANVVRTLSSELDILGIIQPLTTTELWNLLHQMGFSTIVVLDQTQFNLTYTCSEQYMSIVFREGENIALTLVRVGP